MATILQIYDIFELISVIFYSNFSEVYSQVSTWQIIWQTGDKPCSEPIVGKFTGAYMHMCHSAKMSSPLIISP